MISLARNEFHLKALKTIYIMSLKQDLCIQKKFVSGLLLYLEIWKYLEFDNLGKEKLKKTWILRN